MAILRFRYRNAKGVVREHTLSAWSEKGHYVTGYCQEDGGPRTFLKFRVLEYFDGSESALADPHTPAPPRLAPKTPPDERAQILFTGFAKALRTDLEQRAEAVGLRVMKTVTTGLAMLCCGPNAGPKKTEDARSRGSITLSEAEFMQLCETGEIPEPPGALKVSDEE